MDGKRFQNPLLHPLIKRQTQIRYAAHPVIQRALAHLHSMAGEDIFLPIPRQMISELADHDLS